LALDVELPDLDDLIEDQRYVDVMAAWADGSVDFVSPPAEVQLKLDSPVT
jgi:hypothetical protein